MKFYKSSSSFRKWLEKNHDTSSEVWVGFYKKGYIPESSMTYSEACEQVICFGWVIGVLKRIDEATYKVRFSKRRAKSRWSMLNMKKYKELEKKKLIHPSGKKAYLNRDKEASEKEKVQFSAKYIKQFKTSKIAWTFFSQQTNGYRK